MCWFNKKNINYLTNELYFYLENSMGFNKKSINNILKNKNIEEINIFSNEINSLIIKDKKIYINKNNADVAQLVRAPHL